MEKVEHGSQVLDRWPDLAVILTETVPQPRGPIRKTLIILKPDLFLPLESFFLLKMCILLIHCLPGYSPPSLL